MLQTYEGVVQRGQINLPDNADLPDGTRVYISTVPPLLNERQARREAAFWLAYNVGDMLMPGSATLTQVDDRHTWRFPVMIGSLFENPRGPIGYVDVDAETGAVLAAPTLPDELLHNAENLSGEPSTTGN